MRAVNLHNFFSKKVEFRQIVEGKDEVLNGHLPYLPIEDEVARKIEDELFRFEKEKSLYGFAHFIVGKLGRNRVCAPLFFIPARIVVGKKGYSYLELNLEGKFLNVNFLSQIAGDKSSLIIDELKELLERREVDFETSSKIQQVFEKHSDNINADEVLFYPELLEEDKIKSKKPKKGYKLVAGFGYGVIKNSDKTLGVLSELKELSETPVVSEALKSVLSGKNQVVSTDEDGKFPAILSEAQKRAVHNSSVFASSLIIGPPGTGKSFTIANMALDYLQKGKTLLVVSKTDEATEVIFQKLKELGFEDTVIRAGSIWQNRSLMNRVEQLLSFPPDNGINKNLERLVDELKYMDFRYKQSKSKFEDSIGRELEYGRFLVGLRSRKSIISRIKRSYISWKNKNNKPHWEYANDLYQNRMVYQDKASKYVREIYIRRLNGFLTRERGDLVRFGHALRAYTVKQRLEYFQEVNFAKLLAAFPIWLCRSSTIFEVLPMKANLFDCVVVDEATQSDLASAFPALQRARRLAIVGDPNQLRHFSFLSRKEQIELKKRFGVPSKHDHLLNYRDDSLLDVCFGKNDWGHSVTFLNEHYRGNRGLIDFSNREFYNNQLKVMKSLPMHSNSSVNVVICSGERGEEGENLAEANQLLEKVKDIIANTGENESIGIISPFRKQVDLLVNLISTEIDKKDSIKRNIKVGTPYSFQGSERDHMLLSWVVDAKGFRKVSAFLNKREAFNVAVTRARVSMTHLLSCNVNDISSNSLLYKYMTSIYEGDEVKEAGKISDSFLEEVTTYLKELRYDYHVDYTLASVPVDILVKVGEGYKAIDLIGFPGKFYDSIELDHYQRLQRAGVTVFPLPYTFWTFGQEKCKRELESFLKA